MVLGATVAYSLDLNLRTIYFSSFHFVYTIEKLVTRDMTLETFGKPEGTNLLLYIILTLI